MALSDLLHVLEQYRGAPGTSPPETAEQDYSQVANRVPQTDLESALTDAFRSQDTPPFGQMLSTLFGNSNGEQRAGILNRLIAVAGPSLLASGALSSLVGFARGGQVTPQQAELVPPETVKDLADHVEKQNPSIVEQASQFYAQHPTLVQALGAGSLALIMSHLSQR